MAMRRAAPNPYRAPIAAVLLLIALGAAFLLASPSPDARGQDEDAVAGAAKGGKKKGGKKKGGPPKVIASDTAAVANPVPFWGQIECKNASRHELIEQGGDPHPTTTGAPQGNDAFRRVRVLDGDDFYGERCELGDNNRKGPTAFYREGRRRVTSISLRLPSPGFPLNAFTWQTVMQMKQAAPSANSGGSPMIELGAFDGRWRLSKSTSTGFTIDSRKLWTARATPGVWTRFAFDIRYSRKSRKGFIRLKADLNGDFDYLDPKERSRRIRTHTLKTEIRGGAKDGIRAGRSIPDHLRTGIYHDPAVPCPPPAGCFIDIDNVQVVAP